MKQDVQDLIMAMAHSFCEGLTDEESEIMGALLCFVGDAMIRLAREHTVLN